MNPTDWEPPQINLVLDETKVQGNHVDGRLRKAQLRDDPVNPENGEG